MTSEILFQAMKFVQRACPQCVSDLKQRVSSISQVAFHVIDRQLSANLIVSACMLSSAVCLQQLERPASAYFFLGCGAGMAVAQKMASFDPSYFSRG